MTISDFSVWKKRSIEISAENVCPRRVYLGTSVRRRKTTRTQLH